MQPNTGHQALCDHGCRGSFVLVFGRAIVESVASAIRSVCGDQTAGVTCQVSDPVRMRPISYDVKSVVQWWISAAFSIRDTAK